MQDVTWAIAAGLARRKHAVTVITTRVPGGPERFEQDGVEVCGLAGTRPERYSAAFFRGVATTFASLDRERRFDLVHSQSYAAAGLPAGLDRPLVVQLHGVWLSETELEPTVFRTPTSWPASTRRSAPVTSASFTRGSNAIACSRPSARSPSGDSGSTASSSSASDG